MSSPLQCGVWHSVHIDDIHPELEEVPSIADMHGRSVGGLLSSIQDKSEVTNEFEKVTADQEADMVETTAEAIDLTDIRLEETTDKSHAGKRHFKIDYLIRKCIQPALGNVKDSVIDSSRAIERLKIILNCLQNEEGKFNVNHFKMTFKKYF